MDYLAELAALGLTVESKFIPFSQSRNKAEKSPSLNWVITLLRNGKAVLTTDYMAGMAHCPSYNRQVPTAWDRPKRMWQPLACAVECESGFANGTFTTWRGLIGDRSKPILPDPVSVVWSLVLDSSVLDHGTFESWAEEYGYDSDSIKAEKIYRQCLEIALKLRGAIGEAGIQKLQEVFQDY